MSYFIGKRWQVFFFSLIVLSLSMLVSAQDGLLPLNLAAAIPENQQITVAGAEAFGRVLAQDGNTLVIGAPETSNDKGKAYVYVRSGNTWSQQAILTASDNGTYKYFGNSVAINGNTIIVGAPNCVTGSCDLNTGSAYVFVRSGTTWTQQAQLLTAPFNFLGTRVAIDGDTALVTASRLNGPSMERVVVYLRSGTTWSQQAILTGGSSFGSSVVIKGNTAVIGAYGTNNSRGSIYVFERTGTTWSQTEEIFNPEGHSGGFFGITVDFDGTKIVAGTPGNSQNAAFVFIKSGGFWIQEAKLTAPGTAWFGGSVSMSGGAILVADYNVLNSTGRVYVFEFNGSTWNLENELNASDGAPNDFFGISTSLSGSMAVVGTIGANTVYSFPQALVPDNSTELLVNRSFEVDSNGDNSPDGWERINPTGDVRRCTPTGKPQQAVEGNCYYNFHDVADENSDLKQDINVSSYDMEAGDTLTLGGYVNAVGPVVNTRVRILVKYVNEALPADKIVVTYLAPTDGWKALPTGQSITLAGEPRVVRIILNNTGTDGRVRYDYMSLKLDKNAAPLIPLPK